MSNIIRLLPDHVANQIAAGEVVQRPASVVKELIENSVDAGATEIKLVLKEAGKTLIQVIDNGKGMGEQDALLSFERHATSKISKAEDLFALHTKGFRGEALASIAAIAHVELKTRQEVNSLGTHIVIEGGKLVRQEPVVSPVGTSFSVKNLFFNIPARRNFLKSVNVEFRNIVDEFERIALVHNEVQFILIHNGNEVFNLPSSNLRQRIVAIFGSRTNEKLVPIAETTDIVTIEGFVGKPEYAKKNRGEQFFFVNDRYVKSGYLHHAVLAAYEGLLKEGTHPTYFIYLQVPTDSIDINIHPTKTEVKFDDEQALYSILRSTIKHSMGQFNVAPVLDFQRDASLDTPYDYQGTHAATPTIEVDRNFNPFTREENLQEDKFEYNPFENPFGNADLIESKLTDLSIESSDLEQESTSMASDLTFESKGNTADFTLESSESPHGVTYESKSNQPDYSFTTDQKDSLTFESKGNQSDFNPFETNEEDQYASEFTQRRGAPFLDSKVNAKSSFAKSKFNNSKVENERISSKSNQKNWSSLYEGLKQDSSHLDISNLVLEQQTPSADLFGGYQNEMSTSRTFQINRKYIVSPIKSGLVVIDQGRAHQRILYENFLESIKNHSGASQQLLFPLTLYYAPYEMEVLREIRELLQQTGFGFEQMAEEFVVISGLPVHISESEASIVLEDLIGDFRSGHPGVNYSQSERIAKSLAHSLSVKTGTTLSCEEQENIVNRLFACNEPNVSPFMKPTFVTMKVEDIEKKFTL
ncbi:DNA mismatch repair endonuclease MutL [Myroides sp. LJL115]